MNATQASVADLARLNFLLGELYADAVLATARKFRVKADLVGCHGQTLYHQGEPQAFLGRKITTTWQTGEAAVIAARAGVPVVSDFRPADMAAGGKGAPLVPYLDYLFFRDAKSGRIVQNIGGIANLTAIPAGGAATQNVCLRHWAGEHGDRCGHPSAVGRPFDRGGKIAASGTVIGVGARTIAAAKVLPREASKDCGAGRVRTGVCGRVPAPLRTRPERGCCCNSHCAYGAVDRRRGAAIRVVTIGFRGKASLPGNDSLRWRSQKCHLGGMLRKELAPLGRPVAILRRVWLAFGGQRGCGICGMAYETGTGDLRTCLRLRARNGPRCWGRFRMREDRTADLRPWASDLDFRGSCLWCNRGLRHCSAS